MDSLFLYKMRRLIPYVYRSFHLLMAHPNISIAAYCELNFDATDLHIASLTRYTQKFSG